MAHRPAALLVNARGIGGKLVSGGDSDIVKSMNPKILKTAEIDQFIDEGCVVLRQAFPRSAAEDMRKLLWKKLELKADEPAGWTRDFIHIKDGFQFPAAFTDRLHDAFDDVMGAGRWKKSNWLGWWPVSFPGFSKGPWQPPVAGWHVDGIQFHHHVHSADQGLLPIFLFSDIGPGDGGTALSLGSHKITAKILQNAEPDGLSLPQLNPLVNAHPRKQVVEVTGQAGDVALIHPFVSHARSDNTGRSVRFICNPCFSLHEPMNLKRTNASDYSPVERAIVEAL